MEQKLNSKIDVIMAGLGGQGVLMAGQLLSWAALKEYRHVSWLPSYAVEKRGGLCECTVIFSNEEIASPLIDQAQTVVVFDGSQLTTFEPRVLPSGMILAEKTGLPDDQKSKDYKLVEVPGLETAVSMGGSQVNNLILLGTYVGITKAISPDLIQAELENKFGKKEAILEQNQKAFAKGIELGQALKK